LIFQIIEFPIILFSLKLTGNKLFIAVICGFNYYIFIREIFK